MPDTISLSGPWLVRHDPLAQGMAERWWLNPPRDGWKEIRVPSAWQGVLGAGANGVAWYRMKLPVIGAEWLAPGRRVWLRFESVATECLAFINGREVGRHVGDFVPFEFEVTAALRDGGDGGELFVRVDQWHAPRPVAGCITEHGHITKGFHDVLSLQHAGIWGDVAVRRTGDWAVPPGGVHVVADSASGRVRARVELAPGDSPAAVEFVVTDPTGRAREAVECGVMPERPWAECETRVERCELWSPESPRLYRMGVRILQRGVAGGQAFESDSAGCAFGFRTVKTGGPGGRRILVNDQPTLVRGVLHWGHEPRHGAPAPTREEVRAQFAGLKSRGFNGVCCCMVYMPEYFYDLADEAGMLIWQEHPVWKGRMGEEFHAEYKRLYEAFFRRDRNHPSIVIVSGSCEHEAFHPGLAEWWWERAGHHMPSTLRQVQTAFFAWTPPGQTELYDEHTYDNSGRWVCYVKDVRAAIDRLACPDKPFVMGETVISNAWPDVCAMAALSKMHESEPPGAAGSAGPASPWWISRGLHECGAVEREIESEYGVATLDRFRRDAHRHNLQIRKFQCEVLRMDPANAGWVMNHVRDVPACRCGFMDDGDRWRYTAAELRPFLADAAVLLESPEMRRAFVGGREVEAAVMVSNFAARAFEGEVTIGVGPTAMEKRVLSVGRGEVGKSVFSLLVPDVVVPRCLSVRAAAGGIAGNEWNVWALPASDLEIAGVARLDARRWSVRENELDFEERCYSSGWGLLAGTWRPRNPEVGSLLPTLPVVREPRVDTAKALVTHRLTREVVAFLGAGGRVLLLASKCDGGLNAKTLMQWSGVPLVVERGPFVAGDAEWIVDLLHHDLTRRYHRAVPTEEMGIAGSVRPFVRFYAMHDSGKPKVLDLLFAARVGAGVLCVSTLDHWDEAGRYVMARVLRWLAAGGNVEAELSAEWVRGRAAED